MKNLQSKFGYTIHFEEPIQALDQFLDEQQYQKVAILGDTNTLEKCLPYLNLYSKHTPKFDLIEIDPGEENKNIDICIGIWSMMQDFNLNRKSLLINLGGGVITDMGAFAASTYMRGIDFVHIPTSLLAMVDASVGGKTGIDLQHYKNHIGTFSHPKANFIIPELLSSLDEHELRSGFAEVLKHGIIADHLHFRDAVCHLENGLPEIDELIYQSIQIKLKITEQDPYEKNVRKALNFGHTIGHAIESYWLSREKWILHGHAIAAGMILETKLSILKAELSNEQAEYIIDSIRKNIEPAKVNADMIVDMISYMQKDKKNDLASINFSLIEEISKPALDIKVTEEEISKLILDNLSYFNE
jgi:3-dehydroquinate synthase